MSAGTKAIGLTGGIGSGKSTVASYLKSLGAAVVDSDEISRRLTGPGGAAMGAIRAAFGSGYVTSDGALDRETMRTLVFADTNSPYASFIAVKSSRLVR